MIESQFKPSLSISDLISPDITQNSEKFLLFLKAYYEWLQTTNITLENIDGTFVRDEEVVGNDSGAIGTIREVGTDYIVLKLQTRRPFNVGEVIVGQTSDAEADTKVVKDNVVRKTGKLADYRNIEYSVDKYVDYLKDELYPSIPTNIYGDKRLVALKFKDFFQSKGNEASYQFLFKLLYNEEVSLYYPGEDILRISAGNFEKTQIIRSPYTANVFSFLNKTITGSTSGAIGNVVDIKRYVIGIYDVAEMTLKLVSGTFSGGETISDVADATLTSTLYGMITGFNINDGGSGYQAGDQLSITGDGSAVDAVVSSIQQSPISALYYNTIGHGYQIGTTATISNSGTGGSGLIVRVTELANTYTVTSGANTYTLGEVTNVQIINRGSDYFKKPSVTLEDTVIKSLGLLSENLITIVSGGTNYGVGNTIVLTGGAGTGATGVVASVVESTTFDLKFEDDTKMIAETGKDIIKNEEWLVTGAIARIELTNYGTGYTKISLPTISVTSTTGSSANLIATNIQGASANVTIDSANNVTGVGSIRSVELKNFGVNYTTANVSLVAVGDGNANLTPIIAGLGIQQGNWVGDYGKIDYKRIQDSYYYQDFSYVIKSGLAFTTYQDTLKSIIHPAGLQAFGEILIQATLDLTPIMLTSIESLKNEIQELTVFIKSLFDVSVTGTEAEYVAIINLLANTSSFMSNREVIIYTAPLAADVQISKYKEDKIIFVKSEDLSITNEAEYTRILPPSLLNNSNLTSDRQIVVHIESPSDVQISKYKEDKIIFVKSEDLSITTVPQPYEREIYPENIAPFLLTYGEAFISEFSSTPISSVSSSTFNDVYTDIQRAFSAYTKYIPLTGTISSSANTITGTGTTFATEFSVGSKLFANNQLFIVNGVANSTYMTINVNPSAPFIGTTGYKVTV